MILIRVEAVVWEVSEQERGTPPEGRSCGKLCPSMNLSVYYDGKHTMFGAGVECVQFTGGEGHGFN